jgi:lipopolysaccharide export system protein LptA
MKKILYIFIFVFVYSLFGQSLLNIKKADVFKQTKDGRRIIYGNVSIEYDVYKVDCDSAIVDKDLKSAKLFKNVVLQDTAMTIHCDKADIYRYDEKRSAYLTGNVMMKREDMTVYGKFARLVELFDRVTIKDSVRVEYNPTPSILFCKELKYDTKKEVVSSNSIDSVFALDSLRYYELKTDRAVYDLSTSILTLNSRYDLEVYELQDSIVNISTFLPNNIPRLKKNLTFKSKSTISANKGNFNFESNNHSASGQCKFSRYEIENPDTTFFSCENIDYSTDTGITQIDKNVKLDRGALSVTTDYGEFHHDKDLIKLLKIPKIIYESHTITGDTIYIYADNESLSPKEATIINNAFFESIPDSNNIDEKNHMSGRRMDIWFEEEKLSKIYISKEAEALYFIREDNNSSSKATNYLLGDTLIINLDSKGITNASVNGGCEGVYAPDRLKKKTIRK